nr:hypothetical protein [Kibdelosporangium sp. MJ126-NF4]
MTGVVRLRAQYMREPVDFGRDVWPLTGWAGVGQLARQPFGQRCFDLVERGV